MGRKREVVGKTLYEIFADEEERERLARVRAQQPVVSRDDPRLWVHELNLEKGKVQ